MNYIRLSLSVFFNPSQTFLTIHKYRKTRAYPLLTLTLILVILVRVSTIYLVHFPMATVSVEDADFLLEIVKIIIPFFSWIVGLYAVTSIMKGESTFSEVMVSSCFALYPYIVLQIPLAFVSRIMSLNEIAFYRIMEWGIYAWCVVLFYLGAKFLNNYEVGKTVKICVISLFFILVMWAMITLLYALSSQALNFFIGLIREIRMNLE